MSRPTVVIVCILAPPNRGGLNSTHIHGTSVPVEEPSAASGAVICRVDEVLVQQLPAWKLIGHRRRGPAVQNRSVALPSARSSSGVEVALFSFECVES